MIAIQPYQNQSVDRAGSVSLQPTFAQTYQRIQRLVHHHLAFETLNERLADLPHQFNSPKPRPWEAIDWHHIHPSQVIGVDVSVFCALLVGALDTEAPIRGYTQTSRRYLETLHPEMATFVGGTVQPDGALIEPGLWEKEERQHTPALLKVYLQLTGESIKPSLRVVRAYCPTANPRSDLYRHGVHRIATEYGATCLYLWMIAHSTGPLQAVFEELLMDEINHMTKFWGFGTWAYPEARWWKTGYLLLRTMRHKNDPHNSLFRTLKRMAAVLKWSDWSLINRCSFAIACLVVLHRMWAWNRRLSREWLTDLFGAVNNA
ncbi:MAG: ferritin-like domain-containing protein [Leptolyngbyaceae bacterium]|nr:ferritin-like domain-containing protein [Leptolyngbyaceae bacterium]